MAGLQSRSRSRHRDGDLGRCGRTANGRRHRQESQLRPRAIQYPARLLARKSIQIAEALEEAARLELSAAGDVRLGEREPPLYQRLRRRPYRKSRRLRAAAQALQIYR